MQRWQTEFSKHPIHPTITAIETALNSQLDRDDPVYESERLRIVKIIEVTKRILRDLDPDLAPIEILNLLNSVLVSGGVLTNLRAFEQTGAIEPLRDANEYINPVLSYIYQLSSLRFSRSTRRADIDAASVSFERFSKNMERHLMDFMHRAGNHLGEVKDASERISKIEASAIFAEAEFNKNMLAWTTQTTEALNTLKTDFAETQARNKLDFADAIATLKQTGADELKTIFETQKQDANIRNEAISSDLDEIRINAREKHREILKFYDLVAHDSVTGGHKNIADREYSAAQRWRLGAVSCIVLTIGWLAFSLFCLQPVIEPERLFWVQIAKSVALTAILISFAIYASKQSNLHRRNERKTRAFFLQVQAFDPFIAGLPDDQRFAMKQAITERIFGPDDVETNNSPIDAADFKGIDHLVTLFERLRGLVK